jgi:hypothetical protein
MCLVICANCKLTQGSSLFRISRAAASTERLTCSIGYPIACVIVHEPHRYEYSSSGRVTSNREYGQSGDTRPKGSRRSEIQREQKKKPTPTEITSHAIYLPVCGRWGWRIPGHSQSTRSGGHSGKLGGRYHHKQFRVTPVKT